MTQSSTDQPIKNVQVAAHQAVRAESEPPRVRRYRAVLFQGTLLLVAVAFAGLTFLVKTTPSFAIDLTITSAIQSVKSPIFAMLMTVISWPGFSPQSMVLAGLIAVLIYAVGLHWEAVMALLAAALSTGINLLVKDLVQRPRPTATSVNVIDILNSYSFPSGHVMFYLGFFGFLGFLAFSLLKPSIKRTALLVILTIPIALIGISRIYLGQHWASDVLGAYLLGSLTLVVIIQLYRWGKPRFFVRQPVAAAENQPA
jgi:undecaprenyl-diphosphatase